MNHLLTKLLSQSHQMITFAVGVILSSMYGERLTAQESTRAILPYSFADKVTITSPSRETTLPFSWQESLLDSELDSPVISVADESKLALSKDLSLLSTQESTHSSLDESSQLIDFLERDDINQNVYLSHVPKTKDDSSFTDSLQEKQNLTRRPTAYVSLTSGLFLAESKLQENISEALSQRQIPTLEPPDNSIPEIETPEVEFPETDNPEMESPEIETPEVESPEIETPEMESPEIDNPEMEFPEAETSESEAPEAETPDTQSTPIEQTTPVKSGSVCFVPITSETQLNEISNSSELNELLDLEEFPSNLEELYPGANPLLFPTQPEEVTTTKRRSITLAEAIALGQENNTDLQLARLNLDRSQQVLAEALAQEYPTIGVEANFIRNDSASRELQLEAAGIEDGDTVSTTLDTGITVDYSLYTSGRRSAQIKIAEEQVKFNQLDLERIEEEIRLTITTDYYNLQNADAEVGIELEAVKAAQKTLEDAQLLERAGLGTKFDVLRAEVDLADAKQRLTRAYAQQKVARRQLVERLSLGQQVEVTTADDINPIGQWNCTLEDSIIKAYRNRAELEQFLIQRQIEEQEAKFEEAGLKPQVSLFANYDLVGVLDDDLPPADEFQLGVRLQWTLFDGGRTKARVEQNRIDQTIAEREFENQRNEIRLEVEEAYFNVAANKENIDTATVAVLLARESLRLARLRFQAGVGTQTDVINSQTELTRANGNLLRAIIDYNLSLATLERAVSNLPDERLFDQ